LSFRTSDKAEDSSWHNSFLVRAASSNFPLKEMA